MKLNCIIIDDDIHSINGLKSYISKLPNLNLLHVFTDPLQALSEISGFREIDIVFMDIDMPIINGIELSKAIRHKSKKLIFTTSHSKYAFEAFELHANDYLLKPYSFARFADAVIRLFPTFDRGSAGVSDHQEDYFFVRNKLDQNNLYKIKYTDIVAIESMQNYIRIIMATEFIVAYISLSEIREMLKNEENFMQVHRSFIISKRSITKVEGNMLHLINGQEINIGKSYRENVNEYIRKKTFKTGRT